MTEHPYLTLALKSKAKLRWLIRALKLSRYDNIHALYDRIEEKIQKAIKRKGELSSQEIELIIENILWAKLFRRLQAWKLKPFKYNHQGTNLDHKHMAPPLFDSLCSIFKEHHYRFRTNPAILLPGFVPEGNEAFYLLRHSFLKYGSAYYINFPRDHYNNETVFQQLYDLVLHINQRKLQTAGRKQKPLLVGTSFGCAVIRNFLKWLENHKLDHTIDIAGVVFLSPVLCMEDVCLPGDAKQPTLVARAIAPLLDLDENDHDGVTKAMVRAKGIFTKMFKAGQKQLDASLKSRIPILAVEEEVIDFFNIEERKLIGYFKRYLCLRNSSPPDGTLVSELPTLTLVAEGEKDVLTPTSPTLDLLEKPALFKTMFPDGEVVQVKSDDPSRRVTHSDLIFNADCYRRHLDPWLEQRFKRA